MLVLPRSYIYICEFHENGRLGDIEFETEVGKHCAFPCISIHIKIVADLKFVSLFCCLLHDTSSQGVHKR
jgi:hypothetical protein